MTNRPPFERRPGRDALVRADPADNRTIEKRPQWLRVTLTMPVSVLCQRIVSVMVYSSAWGWGT